MTDPRYPQPPAPYALRPTAAFVGASWAALFLGASAFGVGLRNATMQLNEKGFYLVVLLYGLFAAVSLQKSVRDRSEGVPVSGLYFALCWISVGLTVALLAVGLWNATLTLSEKGFYAMAFALSLFGAVAVQKNVRDLALAASADQQQLARGGRVGDEFAGAPRERAGRGEP